MADHGQVVSGSDGEANCFLEAVVIEDGAHVEIVGHHQPAEAEFAAQKIADDRPRERRWRAGRVEVRIVGVPDHDAVERGEEMAEHGELVRVELGAGEGDFGELVVRVEGRAGVAGKVFATAGNPAGAKGVVECAGEALDFRHVAAVAAAAQGVVGVVVE